GRAAFSLYAAAALRAYGQGRSPSESWNAYSEAVVIDALGSPGGFDPSGKPDDPLSSAFVLDAKQSGLTAVNLTVGTVGNVPEAFERTVKNIGYAERELTSHPDIFVKIWTGADLASAKKVKRLGIIYGFQDAWPLGSELSRLDTFFRLGLRVLQPTYN